MTPAGEAPTSLGVQDARLFDLVASAELEERCPNVVNLLVGSWLIQGRPSSTAQFLQASHDSIFRSFAETREVRKTRGSDRDRSELALGMTRPIIGALERSDDDDGATLNLLDVTIASSTGPSLHPPAIRVPVASVDAWWIVDFEVKNGGGGGSTVVGVGFSF